MEETEEQVERPRRGRKPGSKNRPKAVDALEFKPKRKYTRRQKPEESTPDNPLVIGVDKALEALNQEISSRLAELAALENVRARLQNERAELVRGTWEK